MSNIDFRIKCWYSDGCNLRQVDCQKTCHRYLQMNYLINNCGMKDAVRFLKQLKPVKGDIGSFCKLQRIKDDIVNEVNRGLQLYISSFCIQTGKTTWSLKILYKYFDEIWAGNGFVPRGYFLYVPQFLHNLRNFEYKNTTEYKFLDKILNTVDLVIWDDITSLDLSPQDQNILNMYIDKRVMENKSNIFNGLKLPEEQLQLKLGQKLAARLNMCETVEFVSTSYKESNQC